MSKRIIFRHTRSENGGLFLSVSFGISLVMLLGDASISVQDYPCQPVGSRCHMADMTQLIYGNKTLFSCQLERSNALKGVAAVVTLPLPETFINVSTCRKKDRREMSRQSGRQHVNSI